MEFRQKFLNNFAWKSLEFRCFRFVFFVEFREKIRNKYGIQNMEITEYGILRNSAEFDFFRVKTEYGTKYGIPQKNGIRKSTKFREI